MIGDLPKGLLETAKTHLEDYETFFRSALKKFGVENPSDFKSDEEKKKFFNYVDKNFKGKKEEVEVEEGCGKDHDKMKKEEEKVECPKCEGEGCDHCDGKGYHTEETDEEDEDEVEESLGRIANLEKKAVAIAKKMAGDMTGAVKEIEKMRKGLSKSPKVSKALQTANEELSEMNTYTVVHVTKGKEIVKAKTSYEAAQKFAKMKRLKSTSGVDAHLMDEETEIEEKKIGNMGPYGMSTIQKALAANGVKGAKAIGVKDFLRKSGTVNE